MIVFICGAGIFACGLAIGWSVGYNDGKQFMRIAYGLPSPVKVKR